MTVQFDTNTGRLRLDQQTFDSLVAWAQGDQAAGPELAELRDAGAVRQGVAHPTVRAGLQAITEPVCRLLLASIDDRGECRRGDGWVAPDAAALLLDTPDGMRELVTVHPTLLPVAIARVVRLEPHPAAGTEPLHLSRSAYDAMLSPDEGERRRAAGQLYGYSSDGPMPDVVECLVSGPWRLWATTLTWTTSQGTAAEHALQVSDTRAGLCLVDTGPQDATLWPTSATGVWRRLTLLLPDDVQVD